MIYTALTNKAMKLAYQAHHGQVDQNGIPYIFHPMHLAEQMTDEISACVAILHDVMEDTKITLEELKQEFPAEVTDALQLLTHDRNTDYFEYVRKTKENPIAFRVKLADVLHNSDETRMAGRPDFTGEQFEKWQEKYQRALEILMDTEQ